MLADNIFSRLASNLLKGLGKSDLKFSQTRGNVAAANAETERRSRLMCQERSTPKWVEAAGALPAFVRETSYGSVEVLGIWSGQALSMALGTSLGLPLSITEQCRSGHG